MVLSGGTTIVSILVTLLIAAVGFGVWYLRTKAESHIAAKALVKEAKKDKVETAMQQAVTTKSNKDDMSLF